MNIIQTLMGLLTPAIVGKLSDMLGERSDLTTKALGAAVPAILGGLISKGSSENGAGALIDLAKEFNIGGDLLDKIGDAFGEGPAQEAAKNAGGAIMGALFGDKFRSVADAVTGHSGVSGDAVGKLLGLAAPLIMGAVFKGAPQGGFSPAALVSLLGSQKEHVAKLAPPGVVKLLEGMPGMSDLGRLAAVTVTPPPAPPSPPATEEKKGGLLPWLLAGLVAAGLAAFGLRSCNTPTATVAAPAVEAPAAEPAAPPPPAAPAEGFQRVEIQPGVTLDVREGSIGWDLANYLKSDAPAPKGFTFDNLTFQTSSDQLTPESAETVRIVAEVLKAFPAVTVSVDGYTDATGKRAANVALSQARATSVAAAMTALGVDAARITPRGFGPAKPVATNRTAEGREKNRRVELVVTKK